METIGTSLPRKQRDLFDSMLPDDACQADAIAAGVLLWMCRKPEEQLELMAMARAIRKNKANDRI